MRKIDFTFGRVMHITTFTQPVNPIHNANHQAKYSQQRR
jgi:hypothetical protein